MAKKSVGKLSIVLSAVTKPFVRGMKKASARVAVFAKKIKRVSIMIAKMGVALVATAFIGLAAIVKSTLKSIDATAKLADVLGLTTEQLVGYQLAAKISGVEVKQLGKAFQRMEKNISDATLGLTTAQRAFDSLGLSAETLKRKSPDEQFKLIADAMMTIPNQTDKARVALDLFGRSGLSLLKVMEGGAAGIQAFQDEVKKTGAAFSRLEAAQIEEANDAIARLGEALLVLAQRITVAVAPVLKMIADKFTEMISNIDDLDQAIADSFKKTAEGVDIGMTAWHGMAATWHGLQTAGAAFGGALIKIEQGVLTLNDVVAKSIFGDFNFTTPPAGIAKAVADELFRASGMSFNKFVASYNNFLDALAGKGPAVTFLTEVGKQLDKTKEKMDEAAAKKAATTLADADVAAIINAQKMLDKLQLQLDLYGASRRELELMKFINAEASTEQALAADALLRQLETLNRIKGVEDGHIKRLKDKLALMGKTTKEAELFKIAQAGATPGQLKQAAALLDQINARQKELDDAAEALDIAPKLKGKEGDGRDQSFGQISLSRTALSGLRPGKQNDQPKAKQIDKITELISRIESKTGVARAA